MSSSSGSAALRHNGGLGEHKDARESLVENGQTSDFFQRVFGLPPAQMAALKAFISQVHEEKGGRATAIPAGSPAAATSSASAPAEDRRSKRNRERDYSDDSGSDDDSDSGKSARSYKFHFFPMRALQVINQAIAARRAVARPFASAASTPAAGSSAATTGHAGPVAATTSSLDGQSAIPWCTNAVPVTPEPHDSTFPFRMQDLGVKQLRSLQAAIAKGSFVELVEFAHQEGKDALQQRAPSSYGAVLLGADGGIHSVGDFVALFHRYMDAVLVLHPEQYAPMARYVGFISTAMRTFGVHAVLELDKGIRKRIAHTGDCIAAPQYLSAEWYRLQHSLGALPIRSRGVGALGQSTRPTRAGSPPDSPAVKRGAQVCHNFNKDDGCPREFCRFVHRCSKCSSLRHGAHACKSASSSAAALRENSRSR